MTVKKRSKLRKRLGRMYFSFRRHIRWMQQANTFAKHRSKEQLPEHWFQHNSLLLRKLKSVEMYLQHNKIANLQIAINQLDGVVIQPGQTFSFWYLVGRTNKRKGYKEGLMLDNGQVKKGIGGGLCQLGNLIFWMALHTPLTIQERWRHSYDVFPDSNRTLPFGSGATLAYNYVDLQIKNELKQAVQLRLWLDKTHLHGAFYGEAPLPHKYHIEERNHLFRQEFWGGYSRHNQLYRQIFTIDTDQLIKEELVVENHAILMYRPFLEEH